MSKIEFKRIVLPKVPDQELIPIIPSDAPAAEASDAPVVPDQEQTAPTAPANAHLPELSAKFLLAGKAIFTVANAKGDHYTFKVRKNVSEWPKGSGTMTTSYFVSVKAPGGIYPYRYIGLLNKETGGVKCTAKSEYLPGTKEYDVASWSCAAVLQSKYIPDGYHIEHAGRCGVCGRQLTDPVSIERGIGPECWERV